MKKIFIKEIILSGESTLHALRRSVGAHTVEICDIIPDISLSLCLVSLLWRHEIYRARVRLMHNKRTRQPLAQSAMIWSERSRVCDRQWTFRQERTFRFVMVRMNQRDQRRDETYAAKDATDTYR